MRSTAQNAGKGSYAWEGHGVDVPVPTLVGQSVLIEPDVVRILDRRVFPFERTWVTCRSHEDVAKAIEDMVTQSLGPLFAAAGGMVLAARSAERLAGGGGGGGGAPRPGRRGCRRRRRGGRSPTRGGGGLPPGRRTTRSGTSSPSCSPSPRPPRRRR